MIAVVIVAFQSADVIADCVRSLLIGQGADLRILVVDNASTDDSAAVVAEAARAAGVACADWPASRADTLSFDEIAPVTILRSPDNRGYAGGCNIGLRAARRHAAFDLFWILNPDCVAAPGTAAAYARAASDGQPFALMGSRILFCEDPDLIQSDGGRIGAWTGVARSVNARHHRTGTALPAPDSLDFISGANMVASRAFLDRAGLMTEDYFLYYEEVDWAARRGALPFRLCAEAQVHHHGGTAIGSASLNRRASAFSSYFNFRNRLRFMRRFRPSRLVTAYAWSTAQIIRMLLRGDREAAAAAWRGLNQLPPPPAVRNRLSGAAAALAFDG
jgi:GT2 family glycosyltransferase